MAGKIPKIVEVPVGMVINMLGSRTSASQLFAVTELWRPSALETNPRLFGQQGSGSKKGGSYGWT